LPLELVSFTGEQVEDSNRLFWTTQSEENIAQFNLEKLVNSA
jgi:hypothetical protein